MRVYEGMDKQNVPDSDPLLKRLMNSRKQDILHTSGYAGMQNGDRMGAASAESFHHRAEIDRARSFVGRYKDSRVMRESRNTLPKSESYGGEHWAARRDEGAFSRPDVVDAKARMERMERFEPGHLNGQVSGGSGQPPARRNPGISR